MIGTPALGSGVISRMMDHLTSDPYQCQLKYFLTVCLQVPDQLVDHLDALLHAEGESEKTEHFQQHQAAFNLEIPLVMFCAEEGGDLPRSNHVRRLRVESDGKGAQRVVTCDVAQSPHRDGTDQG